jgi:predicted PurR-regulated permease PerM
MAGLDFRAARSTWTVALVVLTLWLIYLLRSTLFVFTLAVLFAYLLAPLVNLLDRFLPARWTRTRTPALALAYVIVVGLVVVAGILIGTRVVAQATDLAQRFPAILGRWEASFQARVPDALKTEVMERINGLIAALPVYGLRFLALMGNLIYVVIIPVLAFLCLKDGALVRDHVLVLVDPGPRRVLLDDVLADVHLMLAHYMRALVLLSATAFTAYSIFLSVMGIPYAILLAVLAGALEFIPTLGPLAGGAIVLAIAGAASGHVLAILIFIAAFRMCQDYLICPHLMGQGVQLHPLLVLFGVFAGAELAGVAGSFLSVPVLALVRVLYLRIWRVRQQARAAKIGLSTVPGSGAGAGD